MHKVTLLKQPLPPIPQTGAGSKSSPHRGGAPKTVPEFSPAELLLEDMAKKVTEPSGEDGEEEQVDPPMLHAAVGESAPKVSEFVRETHQALIAEHEALAARLVEVEVANTKLTEEIKALKDHVKLGEETLVRDQNLSKQYEEDVVRIREQIRSGELTLRNMEEKANHVAAEKEARLSMFSTSTALLVEERSSLAASLSSIQSLVNSLQQERAALLSKLQAKEDTLEASEQESRHRQLTQKNGCFRSSKHKHRKRKNTKERN